MTADESGTGVAALRKVEITEKTVSPDSYPSIQSLKQTCPSRLFQAEHDRTQNADDTEADTVLYLAYGSNMSAETFLGMRKVRPLSEMNVSVPSLRLNFSLPGFAYAEPCFANVEFREEDEKPGKETQKWDGRLLGVVYEVTKADYRIIMATEGGGSSYHEILVPCVPIPTKCGDKTPESMPEKFMARTLYAPRLPAGQDPNKRSFWERLTTGPYRPDPYYAQPSLRYLNLLRTGAKEHKMPEFYQEYLNGLIPFQTVTWKQKTGRILYLATWAPIMLFIMKTSALFADENGQIPKSMGVAVTFFFNMAWMSYDKIYHPVFGEGERTIESDKKITDVEGAEDEKRDLLV